MSVQDQLRCVDPSVAAAIRATSHFRDSQYVDLDVGATLDYFRCKFVDHSYLQPLRPNHVIADIGCGYGWLAMAFAGYTSAKIVAVDPDEKRLDAAKTIADQLGLGDRISWRVGSAQAIPLEDQAADVTYCVEVLEHVYRDSRALDELNRVAGRYLVVTTPNAYFPAIAHDTCLPFCHWLPMNLRNVYARCFGRLHMQQGNRFWTSFDLDRHFHDFRRVSRFLHYKNVEDFFATYPFYLPYGRGEWRSKPPRMLKAYYSAVSLSGAMSHHFLPSLAGTFERQRSHKSTSTIGSGE